MARSNLAGNPSRDGRSSRDDRNDDHRETWDDGGYDSHSKNDSHGKHESCASDHRDNDRIDCELDLDKRHDGIDLEVDIETEGRWLDVDVEIGSYDFDLKLDGRHLQPDTSPVVSMLGGDGTAVGEETLVDADIFSRLIDLGSITIAFGTAKFTSAAVSDQDLAFAAASTFADVSGADLVFVFTKTTSTSSDCDVSSATETSTTSYIAIDFENFDFAEGQITFNVNTARTDFDECGTCYGRGIPDIDGNVATLDVDALAQSQNTLVDVLASVLTIEDQLSSVSAVTVSTVA